MAIKKTLIQIVQQILSDLDSQDVESITDTLEAQQVVKIVESTYYNIISTTDIPEHYELLKVTAAANSDTPTHFSYGDNVKRIDKLWYDTSDDASFEYQEVCWQEPEEFLERTDGLQSNYTSVTEPISGTRLRIQNNKMPEYFTSFDDNNIICDSYDSAIDTTLQESKVRAMGVVFPVFDTNSDSYVPDMDAVMFPYLINESRSIAMELLKGGTTAKVDQAARRQKAYVQNDMYRNRINKSWSTYGR